VALHQVPVAEPSGLREVERSEAEGQVIQVRGQDQFIDQRQVGAQAEARYRLLRAVEDLDAGQDHRRLESADLLHLIGMEMEQATAAAEIERAVGIVEVGKAGIVGGQPVPDIEGPQGAGPGIEVHDPLRRRQPQVTIAVRQHRGHHVVGQSLGATQRADHTAFGIKLEQAGHRTQPQAARARVDHVGHVDQAAKCVVETMERSLERVQEIEPAQVRADPEPAGRVLEQAGDGVHAEGRNVGGIVDEIPDRTGRGIEIDQALGMRAEPQMPARVLQQGTDHRLLDQARVGPLHPRTPQHSLVRQAEPEPRVRAEPQGVRRRADDVVDRQHRLVGKIQGTEPGRSRVQVGQAAGGPGAPQGAGADPQPRPAIDHDRRHAVDRQVRPLVGGSGPVRLELPAPGIEPVQAGVPAPDPHDARPVPENADDRPVGQGVLPTRIMGQRLERPVPRRKAQQARGGGNPQVTIVVIDKAEEQVPPAFGILRGRRMGGHPSGGLVQARDGPAAQQPPATLGVDDHPRDRQVREPFRRSVAAQDRSLRIQDHHALVGGPQPEIPIRVVTQVLDRRGQVGGQADGFHPAVVRVDPGQQGRFRKDHQNGAVRGLADSLNQRAGQTPAGAGGAGPPVGERPGPGRIAGHPVVDAADPEVAVTGQAEVVDDATADAGRIGGVRQEGQHLVAVIADQARLGADPQEAPVILGHGADAVLGEAFLSGKVFESNGLREGGGGRQETQDAEVPGNRTQAQPGMVRPSTRGNRFWKPAGTRSHGKYLHGSHHTSDLRHQSKLIRHAGKQTRLSLD
jgi:hypothetical protein